MLCRACGSRKRTGGYCQQCACRTDTDVTCSTEATTEDDYGDWDVREKGCWPSHQQHLRSSYVQAMRAAAMGHPVVIDDSCPF